MATTYHVRATCHPSEGGWHYVREDQEDTVTEITDCTGHTGESVSDFCIEWEEETE